MVGTKATSSLTLDAAAMLFMFESWCGCARRTEVIEFGMMIVIVKSCKVRVEDKREDFSEDK